MVKANAYGHGVLKIVDYCSRELQLKSFGLATLGEAMYLRRASGNYQHELYVFSDLAMGDRWRDYLDFKLLPVVSEKSDLLSILNNKNCRHLPLVLHFNTGMNRLGLPLGEVEDIIDQLKKRNRPIYHLMTHFSDSFLPQKKKTQQQYQKFLQLKSAFHQAGVVVEKTSVANSGAIENGVGLQETVIRPGLMLYGVQSTVGARLWPGKLISSLWAEVLDIRPITKGAEVGYGSTPVPKKWGDDSFLYILGLGYGDGLSNQYQQLPLSFCQFRGEIVGRVNMDTIQVIFSARIPLQRGELFPLWHHCQEQLQAIAGHTQLTPYEITCLVNTRVPRIYI